MMKARELLVLCQRLDKEYDPRATVRDIAIMCYLIDHGAKKITEISFGLTLAQPVVSRFVKKLEEDGLVARLETGEVISTDKAKELLDLK